MTPSTHPYDALTPETVLAAVESAGFACDGRLLALNSFENRVYQLGIELDDGVVTSGPVTDGTTRFVVAKFYRPGRWSRAQIAEEHSYTRELAEAEIPVVAPLARDGETAFEHAGFVFALFPRRGGRAPEIESADAAAWLGRTLGRMHAIGARSTYAHRPPMTLATHVDEPRAQVLASNLLPTGQRGRYEAAVAMARHALAAALDAAGPVRRFRLHGDCHAGNVLWTEAGPLFVDFDDARNGPAVQDLWMLMSGTELQRDALLEGYGQFRDFDFSELALIEPLRLMRQIHYAGWVASRWEDPAFPRSFPWAAEARYWEQHVMDVVDGAEALGA